MLLCLWRHNFGILIISMSYLAKIFLIAAMPQFYIHLVYSIGQLRAVSNEKNEYVFFEVSFLNFLCPKSQFKNFISRRMNTNFNFQHLILLHFYFISKRSKTELRFCLTLTTKTIQEWIEKYSNYNRWYIKQQQKIQEIHFTEPKNSWTKLQRLLKSSFFF